MANLFAMEEPLTPPSGVTVSFQNKDGTWPSSHEYHEIPKPPPCLDSLNERAEILEKEVRVLRMDIYELKKECMKVMSFVMENTRHVIEVDAKVASVFKSGNDRHQDLAPRVNRLENQFTILDQRLDFVEKNLASHVPEKRRKLFDVDYPFGFESE